MTVFMWASLWFIDSSLCRFSKGTYYAVWVRPLLLIANSQIFIYIENLCVSFLYYIKKL